MSRQRSWAHQTWTMVTAVPPNERAKYKTRVMKMPSLILQSGLCQAIEYLLSRGLEETGTHSFARDFAKVLINDTAKVLAHRARGSETQKYIGLSRDALDVAAWFRRMAQSELNDVDGDDS